MWLANGQTAFAVVRGICMSVDHANLRISLQLSVFLREHAFLRHAFDFGYAAVTLTPQSCKPCDVKMNGIMSTLHPAYQDEEHFITIL
jgi:hypothetical protein